MGREVYPELAERDVMLTPKDKTKLGIIIEFKKVRTR